MKRRLISDRSGAQTPHLGGLYKSWTAEMKVTLITLLLFAARAAAHQDAILTVRSDGSLEGLPKEYEPAVLTWSGSIPTLELRIGAHETVLPKCLTSKLLLERAEITVHASWYHDRSILPPYIVINIVHSMQKRGLFSGYSLVFNLETGELIQLERTSATDTGQQNEELQVAAFCSRREAENMVHAAFR
jgi:hypothetical protein